jgi:apolipoprotein N-acyltransferase
MTTTPQTIPEQRGEAPRAKPPRSTPRALLRAWGLMLPHSVLMFAMFPPLGGPALGWLALFAIAPLLFILQQQCNIISSDPRYLRARWLALAAFLAALPFWAANQWWIIEVSAPGAPGLMIIETTWTALWMALCVYTCRKLRWLPPMLFGPLAWVAIEFFRGELFGHGYAWSLLAYPLIDYPSLVASAVVGGVYLVSFFCTLVSATLIAAITRQDKCTFALLTASATCLCAGLLLRPPADAATPQDSLRVALVQTNVPQSNKLAWNFEDELAEMDSLEAATITAAASQPKPDVIVWPETMMPGISLETQALAELDSKGVFYRQTTPEGERRVPVRIFSDRLDALSSAVKVPLLIGEDARVNLTANVSKSGVEFIQDARYNSVYYYVDGIQQPQRYDKERLTPFGETMPYISEYPALEKALLDIGAPGMAFDLDSGTTRTIIPLAGATTQFRAVTPICFEITVGPYVRRLVYRNNQRAADVIVNVTNDGWFGSYDSTREQHLQIARMRCLELATPMARVANTGISAFIDSSGRIQSTLAPITAGQLVANVARPAHTTLYGRTGDWLPWSTLISTLALFLFSIVRRFIPLHK